MSSIAVGRPASIGVARHVRPRVLRRMALALPTWGLITTKNLELRRRRGLMIAVFVLILGPPVLEYGFRLLFHAVDPSQLRAGGNTERVSGPHEPDGRARLHHRRHGWRRGRNDRPDRRHVPTPGDHWSVTGCALSRTDPRRACDPPPDCGVGLHDVLPRHELRGGPEPDCRKHQQRRFDPRQPQRVAVPQLDRSNTHERRSRPSRAVRASSSTASRSRVVPPPRATTLTPSVERTFNPPINEMVKIGLWLELVVGVGFVVGLGFGALTGQRTVTTIVLIALQVIVTPIFDQSPHPLFHQRAASSRRGRPRPVATGGPCLGCWWRRRWGSVRTSGAAAGRRGIPPMPTWAMILVIVGWIVGWSVIGAWRMATRDA